MSHDLPQIGQLAHSLLPSVEIGIVGPPHSHILVTEPVCQQVR